MIKKMPVRLLALSLCMLIIMSFIACSRTKEKSITGASNAKNADGTGPSTEPLLEYTIFANFNDAPSFTPDDQDVVSREIEKKFSIKVRDVFYNQGMSIKERLNLFIATNTLPDVIYDINDNVTVPSTRRYAVIGDMLEKYCPNLMSYYPRDQWKDALYNGEMYTFPSLFLDGTNPRFRDDLYVPPISNWAGFWITENNLRKLGFTFTPLRDIAKTVTESQKKPTAEAFKIEPEIKTPEDFANLLKKIKDTFPTVNGKDVIPFNMPVWLEPHLGAMFGLTGNWKYNTETKKVSQFLGDPMAKDYWIYFRQLYQSGLIDKDFAIQKNEQIQEKAIQGRSIINMWLSNTADYITALQKVDPDDNLRQIPMPKQPGTNFAGIDGVSLATYKFFINKDFKDIPRLLKFFDWCQTKEFAELRTWGPESLGLWKMKDGKKVWKDEALKTALDTMDMDYLKKNYFAKGLSGVKNGTVWGSNSKTIVPTLQVNLSDYKRSYPYVAQPNDVNFQNGYISGAGINWSGTITIGVDECTNAVFTWTYGEFENQHSAKLFAAKTDEDFENSWNDLQKYYNENLKYAEAKKRMEMEFKQRGFDVVAD